MRRGPSLLLHASSSEDERAIPAEGKSSQETETVSAVAAAASPALQIAIAGQPIAGRFLVAAVPTADVSPPPVYVQW